MFQIQDRSSGRVVGIRVSGNVTQEDYERLLENLTGD